MDSLSIGAGGSASAPCHNSLRYGMLQYPRLRGCTADRRRYDKGVHKGTPPMSIYTSLALVATLGLSGAWVHGMNDVARIKAARLQAIERHCQAGVTEACDILTSEAATEYYQRKGFTL